jgi:DNA-binding transcriptional regulator YiaG
MLDRAGLRTLRNTLVHSDAKVFQRILNAWRLGAEDELIADATVQDGLLLVRTCALDTLEIDVSELRPLRSSSESELTNFDVADDGSHLHWPALDVHLDLQGIRAAIDPELREELKAERLKSDQRMGQAIRALRNEAGLTQKDIPNLSARQVRRIEKGETSPRTVSLRAFAEAHGLEMNDYLNRVAEEMGRMQSVEID